jgi:hypothetical protein
VQIEKKEQGGKIIIDFFSPEDLQSILTLLQKQEPREPHELLNKFIEAKEEAKSASEVSKAPQDDRSEAEKQSDEQNLYSIKNFSV